MIQLTVTQATHILGLIGSGQLFKDCGRVELQHSPAQPHDNGVRNGEITQHNTQLLPPLSASSSLSLPGQFREILNGSKEGSEH